MKKNIIFIAILTFILFTKVEALTGVTAVETLPDATVAGQYLIINHKLNEDQVNGYIQVQPTYNSSYLELVGFQVRSNGLTCDLKNDYQGVLTCGTGTNKVLGGSIFATTVYRIKSDITANQTISVKYMDGATIGNTTNTVVTAKKKVIDVTKIEIEEDSFSMTTGDEKTIVPKVLPEDATNKAITYEITNTDVLKIDQTGKITTLKAGVCVITIKAGNVTKEVKVTVKDEEVPIKEINTDKELKIKVGDKKKLNLVFGPEGYTEDITTLGYSSSNEKVVVIDKNNNIIAVGSGEAKITITSASAKAEVKVTVEKEVVKEKKKGNGGTIIITVIVTMIITIGAMLVISAINRKREMNREDNDDDEHLNSYI